MPSYIHIKDGHRDKITERIKSLFDRYHHDIDSAYTENENEITVRFTAKMTPGRPDGVKIITGIDFVKEKIKDSVKDTIGDGRQKSIPFPDKKQERTKRMCGHTEGMKRRMRDYR